jgi:uncharacterized membrane protein HdeD (DUF308 family)
MMHKRSRIVLASILGGVLVLSGLALFFYWKGWVPLWCFVPVVLCETIGIWVLVSTIRKNALFIKEGIEKRWIIRFGVAVFLILFGAGLALAAFKLIPDIAWGVGVLLISLGATYIYRAVVLPNSNSREKNGNKE